MEVTYSDMPLQPVGFTPEGMYHVFFGSGCILTAKQSGLSTEVNGQTYCVIPV